MEKEIANFNVKYLQILDENGKVDKKLMPSLKKEEIKKIYELMILTRAFDDKAIKLQREGRIGTYASCRGQEACQIPSALLMEKDDIAFPSFREHGVFIARGMKIEKLFQYWAGDERGLNENINVFPVSIPVGTHLLHAVGAGMAFNYLKEKKVALAYFGDGATSEGDFHEAMNFAGVFKAPVIFICQNNQWAISTPVKEQTASETIAQKAIAYGFSGIKVDGNDVFAVYSAVEEAIKKARLGKGPTFIECLTYRLGDHTTSDDSKKYRSEEEVKKWEKRDPILRLKNYMLKKKMLNEKEDNDIKMKAEKQVNESFNKYESFEKQKPDEIFNYVYKDLTLELEEQKQEFKKEVL